MGPPALLQMSQMQTRKWSRDFSELIFCIKGNNATENVVRKINGSGLFANILTITTAVKKKLCVGHSRLKTFITFETLNLPQNNNIRRRIVREQWKDRI